MPPTHGAEEDGRVHVEVHDPRELQAFQRRLDRSERRFRNLFESIGDAIVVTDHERRIVMTNPAFETMFGYHDLSQVAGHTVSVLYAEPQSFEDVGERITAHTDTAPMLLETRFRRASGEAFDAELRLCFVRADNGMPAGYVGVIRDVTATHNAALALRQSEAFANAIFANSPVGIQVYDARGYSLRMNEAQRDYLGLPDTNFGVGEFNVLTHGFTNESGVADYFRRAYAGEVVVVEDCDFGVAPDSSVGRFAYDLTLFPICDHDGNVQAVVSFTRDISERKEAEAERERSQANLSALIENTDDFIWSVSSDYRLVTCNAAFLAHTSEVRGHALQPGDCLLDADISPALTELWGGFYDRAFAGEHFTAETQVELPGGEITYRDVSFNPIRGSDGGIVGVTAFSRDVTARRLSEEARHESEERYRKTFESLHDVFHKTDLEGRFLMISPSCEAFYGWKPEELLGTHAQDLYVYQRDYDALAGRLLAGEKVNDIEALMRRRDGSTVYVSINAKLVLDANRNAIAVQGTTRDVSERKRAEDALRESEERYRSTFETLHDVFYQTDPGGFITLMSPSCLRHTGYAPDELEGTAVGNVFNSQEEFAALLAQLRVSDNVNDYEATLVRKDGLLVPISVNCTTLRDPNGAVTRYQGTIRDITERKLAENERDRIFTLSVDMLSVIVSGGTLVRVNPAWQRTLGYRQAEVIGENVWSFVHPDDLREARRGARGVDDGEAVTNLTARFRCKDGDFRWLSWSIAPMSADGTIYCVARDVSELMLVQDEMVRARNELEASVRALRASQAVLEEQAVELDRLRLEAVQLANHDMLTGAANRRAWFAHAVEAKPSAIAIFDIDHFKSVNDSHGHPAGDAVLKEVANRLQSALPDDALLGRIGGEEFGVVFLCGFAEARAACAAAVHAVSAHPVECDSETSVMVTVSGGLAPWRASTHSREHSLATTYEEADAALYEAKEAGRHRLVVRGPRAA